MLSRVIATAYEGLVEGLLWLMLVFGGLAGYSYWGDWIGALVGVIGAFFFDVVVFGALLVILDIRRTLNELAQRK